MTLSTLMALMTVLETTFNACNLALPLMMLRRLQSAAGLRVAWPRTLPPWPRGPRCCRFTGSGELGVLPALPAVSEPGAIPQEYESYMALDSSGGVLGFVSDLRARKTPAPAPLPQVQRVKSSINHSRHKLNDVCRTIRGLSAHEAIVQLHFSQKRVADDVRRVVAGAMRAATGPVHALNADRLVVAHAYVGRNTPLKRVRYHSQSRMGQVHKPRTRLTVVLEEVPHGDPRAVGRVVSHRAGKVPNRPRWVKPVMDAPEPGV